eukprot:c3321_g1_i1.p1 GENE.c3321_g1_i1~~c3321_g1_i1.p1  ORF type:complete len:138 (+),score=25.71 c3321_g1_i1:32-445(+)
MAAVTPLVKRKIVKKKTNHFRRHHWDRYTRLGQSVTWRKPKGIDSCVRRRYKGQLPMPNIGYGSNQKTRHLLPNGLKKFQVSNIKELEVLLMQNRVYAAEIAHNVSSRKRAQIVERAAQLNVKLLNGNAKLNTEQHE